MEERGEEEGGAEARSQQYLQRELVHGMDFIQVVHDEVKQRRSGCRRSVMFTSLVYLTLRHFGHFDLQRGRHTGSDVIKEASQPNVVFGKSRKYLLLATVW